MQLGDILGQVGMSGQSNFPHLHLSVSKYGNTIDLFRQEQAQTCSQMAGNGLWHQAPFYSATSLFTVGFSTAIPSFSAVKLGAARLTALAHNDAALVLYGYAFYTEAGDLIDLKVTCPEGISVEHTTQIEKTQSQLFRAFGKRHPQKG